MWEHRSIRHFKNWIMYSQKLRKKHSKASFLFLKEKRWAFRDEASTIQCTLMHRCWINISWKLIFFFFLPLFFPSQCIQIKTWKLAVEHNSEIKLFYSNRCDLIPQKLMLVELSTFTVLICFCCFWLLRPDGWSAYKWMCNTLRPLLECGNLTYVQD